MFPDGERVNSRGPAKRSPRCDGEVDMFPDGERVNSRGPAKRSPRC